jgi:hypothetical protein
MTLRNLIRPRRAAAVAAAGVLAAGTIVAAAGPARAGSGCTGNTYGWGADTYGWCIEQIDYSLNGLDGASNWSFPYLAIQKPWTSTDASAVMDFQRGWGISVDGIVGWVTWSRLCTSLDNHGLGGQAATDGC